MSIPDSVIAALSDSSIWLNDRSTTVVSLTPANSEESIGLTAAQAVAAAIEPAGNFGRSKVTFQVELTVEVKGKADAVRLMFAKALLAEIEHLRETNDVLRNPAVEVPE